MEYSAEVFSHQYPVVLFCVHYLARYQGLKAAKDKITEHKEFWASTRSGHLKLATTAWCNVFGSRDEHMRWSKLPTSNTAKSAIRLYCEN